MDQPESLAGLLGKGVANAKQYLTHGYLDIGDTLKEVSYCQNHGIGKESVGLKHRSR